jgi:hypothetical protein
MAVSKPRAVEKTAKPVTGLQTAPFHLFCPVRVYLSQQLLGETLLNLSDRL